MFTYLDILDDDHDAIAELKASYRRGGLRDAVVKCCIKAILCDTIGPIRERRAAVTRDRDFVMNVLRAGAAIAREVTATTPAEVLAGLGLFTWS